MQPPDVLRSPLCDSRTAERAIVSATTGGEFWRAYSHVSCGYQLVLLILLAANRGVWADEASLSLAAPQVAASAVAERDVSADRVRDLLRGPLEAHWEHFCSREGVSLAKVWKVVGSEENRVLICTGEPKGFLYSREAYSDFELKFEWMFVSDPDGNSGVLVFTQNEPRLWPTSMQIQLHQPSAGAVFPSGDAKSDNSTDPTGPPLTLGVGQWNTCEIVGRGGRLSVRINDKSAGEVSGCLPTEGRIALQSEGAETHFRRMQLTILSPLAKDAATTVSDSKAPPLTKQPNKLD